MILVTTPTGNSGKYVLREIIKSGKPVRAFVRNAKKIPEDLRNRCEVIEGDLRDEVALRKAQLASSLLFFALRNLANRKTWLSIIEFFRNLRPKFLRVRC